MPETQKLDHPEVNRDESGTVVDAAGEPLGEVAAALFGDFEDADFADAAPVIEQLDQSERHRAALDEKIDDLESGGRAGTHEHTHELANHDATWGTVEGERGSEAQHAAGRAAPGSPAG